MAEFFDVAVIGAGPAGAACGISLQKNGVKHCLIDKAVFPRHKTCAGLVTGKTHKLIQSLFDSEDTEGLFCNTASRVKLYKKTELLADAPITAPVRFVDREVFDNSLAERYKALGGLLFEGERGVRIDTAGRIITLSDGREIGYKYIVFADGAFSMSRRLFNIEKKRMACGIEVYVPREVYDTDSVDLYFDYLDDGYLWAFPHGDTVCLGAANLFDRKLDYRDILNVFLKDIGADPAGRGFVGAFLPYGHAVDQDKLPDNVFLTGDAGGFADPISGEGLYMALKTGILAAEALVTDRPKREFMTGIKPVLRVINDGRKVQKMFYSPKMNRIFLSKVAGKERAVTFFFDKMVEEYRYDYRDVMSLYTDYKNS